MQFDAATMPLALLWKGRAIPTYGSLWEAIGDAQAAPLPDGASRVFDGPCRATVVVVPSNRRLPQAVLSPF